jgi:hypothetical protein
LGREDWDDSTRLGGCDGRQEYSRSSQFADWRRPRSNLGPIRNAAAFLGTDPKVNAPRLPVCP